MQSMLPPYPPTRIFLHWLSAVVILWAMVSGFAILLLPRASLVREAIDIVNPGITTLFIPFFLVRAWLYAGTKPARGWRRHGGMDRFAVLGHAALYACTGWVLLSGLLMMPDGWRFLGMVSMPGLPKGSAARLLASHVHFWLDIALVLLVSGHVSTVVLHAARGRPVLYRMTAWRPTRDDA